MTGKGILEALSFVDERYIEEAETGAIRPKARPFRKVLLPLAACLCVALLGLFPEAATESVRLDAKDPTNAAMQETQAETAAPEKTENALNSDWELALDEAKAPHISEVPSIVLRIEAWAENGFSATVEGHVDSEVLPIGETVLVEFLPDTCMEELKGDLVIVTRRIPTEADFPAGTLVQIRYVSISAETGVIRAEAISLARDE